MAAAEGQTMTVHVRPYRNGGYEYHIVGRYPDGEPYEERRKSKLPTQTETRRFAERRERQLHDDWEEGRREEHRAPPFERTWLEYIEWSKAVKRNQKSTLKWKAKIYRQLAPHIPPHTPVDKIESMIDDLWVALGRLGPKTANNAMGGLGTFLDYCQRRKHITHMPRIDMLPVPEGLPKFVPRVEYAAVSAACDELAAEGVKQPLRLWLLGGDGGLRMQEMIPLRGRDIDRVARVMHIHRAWSEGEIVTTKGKRFRSVPLTDELLAALDGVEGNDLVFEHEKGREVTPSVMYRWFRLALERAGVTTEGALHALRHTFGSHLAQDGVDAHKIKDLLGHANLATTERYARLAAESVRPAIDGLQRSRAETRRRVRDEKSAAEIIKENEGKGVGAVGIEPPPCSNSTTAESLQKVDSGPENAESNAPLKTRRQMTLDDAD
jgi:integrase